MSISNTPNISLQIPSQGHSPWQAAYEYNWNLLDTEIQAVKTHKTSTGEDHTYINQDVRTSAAPYFSGQHLSPASGSGLASQTVRAYSDNAWEGHALEAYRYRGTNASPAAVVDGDTVFRIKVLGRAPSGAMAAAGDMRFYVDGTPSGSAVPGKMTIFLADTGGTLREVCTLRADGSVKFRNYTLPAADGTAGQSLKTNGSGALYWG